MVSPIEEKTNKMEKTSSKELFCWEFILQTLQNLQKYNGSTLVCFGLLFIADEKCQPDGLDVSMEFFYLACLTDGVREGNWKKIWFPD